MQPAPTYVNDNIPWIYASLDFPHFGVLPPAPEQPGGLHSEVAHLQREVHAFVSRMLQQLRHDESADPTKSTSVAVEDTEKHLQHGFGVPWLGTTSCDHLMPLCADHAVDISLESKGLAKSSAAVQHCSVLGRQSMVPVCTLAFSIPSNTTVFDTQGVHKCCRQTGR